MLSVESLSKSFGETQVLKNINLDIPDGETTVILGPSGSGKSTLLRCLNLLETPQSGTLTIDDAQVDYSQKLTDAQVRDIRSRSAMVFQQFNLFPNYTALKNVALAPTLNGTLDAKQAQERARELLAKVGLADKTGSYPESLSGGQQRYAALQRRAGRLLRLGRRAHPQVPDRVRQHRVHHLACRTSPASAHGGGAQNGRVGRFPTGIPTHPSAIFRPCGAWFAP